MIKINSELPITLLKEYNEKLNDFDLILFHLYVSEPEYKKYYDDLHEYDPLRMMILDNSAYEFFIKGEELDLNEYERVIKSFKPQYYVLPDTLMNKERTMQDVNTFRQIHQKNIEEYFREIDEVCPQPIAVVQGNTIREFNECLVELLEMGYKNISFPFHNTFFKDEFKVCDKDISLKFSRNGYRKITEDVRYAMGRCMWLKHYGLSILQPNGEPRYDMLHFLGSHCPVEKKYYNTIFKDNDNISMDTGYPVKCGINFIELGTEKEKPNVIIDEFMHDSLEEPIVNTIVNNVMKFKNY